MTGECGLQPLTDRVLIVLRHDLCSAKRHRYCPSVRPSVRLCTTLIYRRHVG